MQSILHKSLRLSLLLRRAPRLFHSSSQSSSTLEGDDPQKTEEEPIKTRPPYSQRSSNLGGDGSSRGETEPLRTRPPKRMNNFDSLISSFSSAETYQELFLLYKKNEENIKPEQISSLLRILARQSNQWLRQIDSFQKDPIFVDIQKKTVENLDKFTEHELLDVLFWLRKSRVSKIVLHHRNNQWNRLSERVIEFVKSKFYNCRNLVNLYFDLTLLNNSVDMIAIEIYNELKRDPKSISTFSMIQIAQAASSKENLTHKEFLLLNVLLRSLNDVFDELDLEQKSLALRFLAKCELNYNFPRYVVPHLFTKIKNDLKEKLEQLSEGIVLNIIIAYQYLPKDFGHDLLDELKETVILTLQHNQSNIKSYFLIEFLLQCLLLSGKRKRLSESNIQIITNEICQRLRNKDEEFMKFKNIEKLAELYGSKIKSTELVEELYKAALERTDLFKLNSLIEMFIKNEYKVKEILEKVTSLNFQNIGKSVFSKIKFYVFLKNEEPSHVFDGDLDEFITSNLTKVITGLNQISLDNPVKNELLLKCAELLKAHASDYNAFNLFRYSLELAHSKELRLLFVDYYRENLAKLDEWAGSRWIDAFSSLKDLNIDQVFLFLQVFSMFPNNAQANKKFLNCLKNSRNLYKVLDKYEFLVHKMCVTLIEILNREPEEMKTAHVFTVILKLDSLKMRNMSLIGHFAKMIVTRTNLETFLQVTFTQYLLNCKMLSSSDCTVLYERFKDSQFIDNLTKFRLFNISLMKSKEISEQNLEILSKNLKEVLKLKMEQNTPKSIVLNNALLLSFPFSMIQNHLENIEKDLKEYLGHVGPYGFLDFMKNLSIKHMRDHNMAYNGIVKEIFSNLIKYQVKMPISDLIDVLENLQSIHYRNLGVFNSIFDGINNSFSGLKPTDLPIIIRLMSNFAFIHKEVLVKTTAKINERIFQRYSHEICRHFFFLNFNDEKFTQIFLSQFAKARPNFSYLLYICSLNSPNESELLEKFFENLKNTTSQETTKKSAIISKNELFRLVRYLEVFYPEKNFLEQLTEYVGKEKIEGAIKFESEKMRDSKFAVEFSKFLKAMKIEYEEKKIIDSEQYNFYLPQLNACIKLSLSSDFLLDRKTLNGLGILQKKTLDKISDKKCIFISQYEIRSLPDIQSKIKFLIEKGIQSSVPESEFDLSLIVQEQSTKKTGTPIEQEEILPDQEEVEEKVEEKEEIERVVIPEEEEAPRK